MVLSIILSFSFSSLAENATNPNHMIAGDESNKYLENPYKLPAPPKKVKFTPVPNCYSLSGNFKDWCLECTGRGKTFGEIPVTASDKTGYECR